MVGRRAPDPRSGDAHGAKAQAVDGGITADAEGAGSGCIGHEDYSVTSVERVMASLAVNSASRPLSFSRIMRSASEPKRKMGGRVGPFNKGYDFATQFWQCRIPVCLPL